MEELLVADVKNAVKSLKNGKAAGLTIITAEHFKWLDIEGAEWLTMLMNKIMEEKTAPVAWTRNYLIKIYKEKGDPLQCKNFIGIKLLEVGLKALEKVMDKRLGKVLTIGDAQFRFQPEKGTIDAMFIFRQVQESLGKEGEKLFVAFLDLEKTHDRIRREIVYWCMRKRGTSEKLVRIVEATYKVTTRVRLPFGDTEDFKIKVGLHQRSALSSFLSILVLDTLTGHNILGVNFC